MCVCVYPLNSINFLHQVLRYSQKKNDGVSGPFSRSAVNYNAGCKTAASNIVMAIAVMLTLLFLTPLFYHTPLVVLSAIIVSAMLGLIDYEAAIHLYKIDKFDFLVCMSAYIGVVFGSVEIGLVIAVYLSIYLSLCRILADSVLGYIRSLIESVICFSVIVYRLQYLYLGYFYLLQGQGHLFWETFQTLPCTEMLNNIQMQTMFLES